MLGPPAAGPSADLGTPLSASNTSSMALQTPPHVSCPAACSAYSSLHQMHGRTAQQTSGRDATTAGCEASKADMSQLQNLWFDSETATH